jgi:hypothetical protein
MDQIHMSSKDVLRTHKQVEILQNYFNTKWARLFF